MLLWEQSSAHRVQSLLSSQMFTGLVHSVPHVHETGSVQPLILGASAAHNECGGDCITATQLATLQQVTEL